MADWYYLEGETSRGPAPEAELRTLLREQRLPAHVLVWRDGMSDWATAESLGLVEVPEPPTAEELAAASTAGESAQARYQRLPSLDLRSVAWRRLVARLIDTILFMMLLAMGATAVSPEFTRSLIEEGNIYANIIGLALFIPVEALLLSRTGRTPGKRMLGLWVTDSEGRLLDFKMALERSLRVYIFGQACGLPIFSMLAKVFAYQRYLRGGTTVWDVMSKTQVVVEELTPAKRNLVSILMFVYLGILLWLASESMG